MGKNREPEFHVVLELTAYEDRDGAALAAAEQESEPALFARARFHAFAGRVENAQPFGVAQRKRAQ